MNTFDFSYTVILSSGNFESDTDKIQLKNGKFQVVLPQNLILEQNSTFEVGLCEISLDYMVKNVDIFCMLHYFSPMYQVWTTLSIKPLRHYDRIQDICDYINANITSYL